MTIYTIQDRNNTYCLRDYDDRKGCVFTNDIIFALKFDSRVAAAEWMSFQMPDEVANKYLIVKEEEDYYYGN